MMRKLIYLLILNLSITTTAWSQALVKAPRVLFALENFYHPEEGAYVELYLSFDALSLTYNDEGDYHQAKLEILYVVRKGESVIKYQKYEVLSPKMKNEIDRQDFADMQVMTLKPGNYTIDVSISDVNSEIKPIKASQKFSVSLKDKKMAMSDFMLEKSVVETLDEGPFVKNGLEMTPWLVSTIPSFMNEVYLYAEVYNSDYELGANGAYIEKHTLRNLDVDSVFSAFSLIKRVNTNKVNVIVKHLDLTSLPQGSYSYTIDLFNRENQVVASNGKQFYRESDISSLKNQAIEKELANFEMEIRATTNRDSIVDFVRSVRPLVSRSEQTFIDNNWKNADTYVLQSFLISLWSDYKKENTFNEWVKYRKIVALVNKEYGSAAKPGYDTDQGMTYLKFGPPDQITDRANEPSSYPYIIWQYYAHPLQSNAMYVFYDPSLTYRDYLLLHSNVRGEKNNERWRLVLQSRNNANGDIDKDRGEDHWGGQVDDYYENPR